MKNLSIAVLSGIMGLLISQLSKHLMIKTLTGDILINIGLPTVFIVMTYILLAK
jgi:hypothetical protein